MITDSQVGIPRPPGVRRTEQKQRATLLSLLTEHFVAKLIALLFAGVLVFLIDRETTTTLVENELFEVRFGDQPIDSLAPEERVIILDKEPSVAIKSYDPHQVRVTIRGQQKLRDQIKKQSLVGRVSIKREWLKQDTQGSQTIDGGSVNFGMAGISVTLQKPIQLELDTEVTRTIPLKGIPKDPAFGFDAGVAFEPTEVKVIGPASYFNSANPIVQITVTVPTAGRTQDFDWPVSNLPPELLEKQIRMAPGQQVTAKVKLTKVEQQLPVPDVPIRWLQSNNDYTFSPIGLPRRVVLVTLTGTPDAVAQWRGKLDDLRKMLWAGVDTDKILTKVAAQLPQPGQEVQEFGPVEVLKIPENLKLVGVAPSQVDWSVRRNQ